MPVQPILAFLYSRGTSLCEQPTRVSPASPRTEPKCASVSKPAQVAVVIKILQDQPRAMTGLLADRLAAVALNSASTRFQKFSYE
jgi:hypothetical protein